MTKIKILFLFLFLIGLSFTLSAQNAALNTFVKSSNLKYAGVGIKIVDLNTRNTVCKYNENLALIPASTLKLLTTASALEIFGERYRYTTDLYAVGNINETGTLDGFLLIRGSGDPTLGSEYLNDEPKSFLKDWFMAVQNAGIKRITNGISACNNPDCYEPVSNKWILEDIGNYFAPEIYSISVFDNTYRLYLRSGQAGITPEIIKVEPQVNLIFKNYLKTASNNMDSAYIRGIPFNPERSIYGTIPAKNSDFIIKGSIPQPPVFLAEYFKNYLIENGIYVGGKAEGMQRNIESSDKLLKVIYSKPLSEIIKVTNFKSNNHYAESLFFTIGKEKTNATDCSYIPKQSAEYMKGFWESKGINMSGAFIYDGSGLSPSNAISAGLLTDLLIYMNKNSMYSETFYNSLPEAGKEGTVQNFLKTKKSDVTARIKSGSINNVQSYAGYINKDGKKYAFAIMVNNFTDSRATLKKQIEDFLLNF
ncbi:MAG: D-alanyl-D-alanine carboxypeptidase/D-alanyl-D-alanine-endopeptidase [Candidatus Azobacteroides sp.]|nr:D-alanyl-D-alanine carboxypeptidase/D-alanyl-D-alanine-endopeptidase [Candidatus Azobacteroides sp.]